MGNFKYILLCVLLLSGSILYAQQNNLVADTASADTLATDTTVLVRSNEIVRVPDSILYKDLMPFYSKLKTGPGSDSTLFTKTFPEFLFQSDNLGLNKKSVYYIDQLHTPVDKDAVFYVLVGILILLAVVMYFYNDYFVGFLQSFTQPTYRLSLTNENYALGFFPSFLLNILFVITAGLFIAEVTTRMVTRFTFWELFGIYSILIAAVYLIKFAIIKLSGYLFSAEYASKLYTHIVFMVNKFIGILLIPVLWTISFSASPQTDPIVRNVYSVFTVLLILLIIYRYFVSFVLVKNNLKINAFHFFVYLCAVEIIPILIIYKFITDNINKWV